MDIEEVRVEKEVAESLAPRVHTVQLETAITDSPPILFCFVYVFICMYGVYMIQNELQ